MSQHPSSQRRQLHWLLALLSPVAATLVCWLFAPLLPAASLALFYLAGVLLTAVYTSPRPALLSALLSFLSYNFFFTVPHFTLFILHREDILTASLMVLIAVVTGQLAAGLREKVTALQNSEQWSRQQMTLTQSLAGCVHPQELVSVFLQELPGLLSPGQLQTQQELLPSPQQAAPGQLQTIWQPQGLELQLYGHPQASYRITMTLNTPLTEPLRTRLDVLTGILRLAWGQAVLAANLRQETVMKEREQLRSALLSSISHDLRTPLATMIGSVSSLCDLRPNLSESQQDELLRNTLSEARRLDRYIQKLLDMTKIGQGELKLERDWSGADDILSVALKRLQPLLTGQRIQSRMEADLPLLFVHAALLEQAVFNVLENAVRYTPPGQDISIHVHRDRAQLLIDITDSGPGIPEALWPTVFDMFFTLAKGDQQTGGTGLGLTICQGILAAHGGSACVLFSAATTGTCFRLALPVSQPDCADTRYDTHSDY